MVSQVPDQDMAYIARCKCGCGSIVFTTVDRPEYAIDNANEIYRLIRGGYSIDRVPSEYVRQAQFGCKNRRME